MKFLDQSFEYLVHGMFNPSNEEFDEHDYDSKEYKNLEHKREYFNLMLNELGAVGWEVVSMWDDPRKDKKIAPLVGREKITKFLFKRSSRSKHYRTGFGANIIAINELAKQQAEANHIN